MATYLNHVAIAAPRNGTTSHTVDPSSGTAVAGTLFTPTAGRLLLCVADGSVTSTTPSGWTLPPNGSAVNFTGLYVWHRVAAGSDIVTTTHNASDYAVAFHFIEFEADTVFVSSVSNTAVATAGGAGPTLTGLTGINHIFFVAGQSNPNSGPDSMTWSTGTEIADTSVVIGSTDGYNYSAAHLGESVLASASSAATSTETVPTIERLVFAVKPPVVQDEGSKNSSAMQAMTGGRF